MTKSIDDQYRLLDHWSNNLGSSSEAKTYLNYLKSENCHAKINVVKFSHASDFINELTCMPLLNEEDVINEIDINLNGESIGIIPAKNVNGMPVDCFPDDLEWISCALEDEGDDNEPKNESSVCHWLDGNNNLFLSKYLYKTKSDKLHSDGKSRLRNLRVKEFEQSIRGRHGELFSSGIASDILERIFDVPPVFDGAMKYKNTAILYVVGESVKGNISSYEFKKQDASLSTDEVFHIIRGYWEKFVSYPWSNKFNGDIGYLKYMANNTRDFRWWAMDLKGHYGYRARTRDHTWLEGYIYINDDIKNKCANGPINDNTFKLDGMYIFAEIKK